MRIEHVRLERFRNLCDQDVELNKRITLLIGKNGQGKTSLLEGIYVLSQGKSFRSARPREFIRWGDTDIEGCAVDASVSTEDGLRKLAYRVVDGTRRIFVNDERVSNASDFYGQLVAICFTPDDLQIVKGAPSIRRQFVDRILAMVDGSYVDHLVQFQRALKSRNNLLQTAARQNKPLGSVSDEIAPWNGPLIEHALPIVHARKQFIETIKAEVTERYRELSAGSAESVVVSYRSRCLHKDRVLEKEDLHREFQKTLPEDYSQRKTGIGPHLDDIYLGFETPSGRKLARKAASQGQARSLALALKFAAVRFVQCTFPEPPLLLLDDVESELDRHRRKALYELVFSVDSQVIITATELPFELENRLSEVAVFSIEEGQINPLKKPQKSTLNA